MTATYFAIATDVGNAKDANAKSLGLPRKYVALAIGDGGGDNAPVPTPKTSQKALLGEWRRAPLNSLGIDPNAPSQLIAEQVIPETVGGKWIRELGLFDEDGDLCYVSNAPPTYKPTLPEGSGKTQSVRMVLINSSGVNVELKIDPSVILATRDYADKAILASMKAHIDADDPHPQYPKKIVVTEAISNSITSHVSKDDPHQQYAKKTVVAESISDSFAAHVASEDPHHQYLTLSRGQEIGFNFSRYVTLTKAGITFSAAHFGAQLDAQVAGNFALPDSAATRGGATISLRANVVNGVTLVVTGTDTISTGSASITSLTLNAGDTAVLMNAGNGYWILVGGSQQLGSSSLFSAMRGAAGWTTLPNGLLFQWLGGTFQTNGTNQTMTASFPRAFPNAVWTVILGNSENGENDDATVQWRPTGTTKETLKVFCARTIQVSTGWQAFAIGN
ncbi:phage tail protein [Pandoraea apista]|uniref:phage tail protein n=1 Tax=Pandoraea apista TaxID=93218 RepID=UPI000F67C888|nr:phage tail protein [Pandoraea apista]RRW94286.1 hypothetical protein EGJ54_18275 [Pandoraea apista]RRX00644.1 hypothetical protein EGJ56_18920 [Pandoraea apista]